MGISESSLKTGTKPLSDCVNNVFGSLNCVCKSKCCDYYKLCNCYGHCRTIDEQKSDETDDELIINNEDLKTPIESSIPTSMCLRRITPT